MSSDLEKYPFPNITLADVQDAAKRIEPYVTKTPVMTCSSLDKLSGKQLFFKCEIFQKIGAFKFRGACNAVFKLTDEQAQKGVVTHSSGNHAQALALAATMRGIPSHIVMPKTAPLVKKQATEGYGGKVVLCEPTLASREATANNLIQETGGMLIHPYNDLNIMAGQGTLALEFLEQVKDLDAIIAPISGGGMISGITIAVKGVNPNVKVYAAEPKGADDAARSKNSGVLVTAHTPNSSADGLLGLLGHLTWPIVRDKVDGIYTVSEEEIKAAMRLVFERMKVVIEPSAAVGVAVVLSEEFKKNHDVKRVGIVLCGGNVDLDQWKW